MDRAKGARHDMMGSLALHQEPSKDIVYSREFTGPRNKTYNYQSYKFSVVCTSLTFIKGYIFIHAIFVYHFDVMIMGLRHLR